MGIFGGGGGSVDISGGVNAIQQGTQQGISAIQKYYGEAVPALKDYFSQAQGSMAPYGVSGGNANDALYDLLGVARPEIGTYQLSAALKNEDMLRKLQEAPEKKAGWLDPESFKANTGYSPSNLSHHSVLSNLSAGHSFDPVTGDYYSAANGAMDTGADWMDDPAANGLKVVRGEDGKYRLESLATDARRPLTAQEQAQWDLIQKYKAGTLGMTDPNSKMNSALDQLYNTPGYQFTLQQGLQGVDRSAAARGLINSGAAIKGATNYASGLAQKTYNDRVGQLSTMAGAGQTAANTAAALSGQLGTGLANAALGTGSNIASLYGSQAQGLSQLYAGQAAAQAQQNAAGTSGLFSLGGSLLGMFSDARLKTKIKKIGKMQNGLPLYEYYYIWDKKTKHVGVMAHEVLDKLPEAVGVRDGFLTVNYAMLGE